VAGAKTFATPEGEQTGAGESRRLAMNFVLLAAGECVSKLLTFAAFSYFARHVGPEAYGAVEFTIAVMVFFTLPADLGLGAYGAREIAKNVRKAHELFREIMGMRVLLACCSFVALLLFIAVIDKSAETKALMAIYGLTLFGGPALVQWFFQAHDLMQWVAAASIVRQLTFAGLMFSFFQSNGSAIEIGVIEVASVFTTALFCLAVVRWRLRLPILRPSFDQQLLVKHLREAVPIGLTELAWAFMWYFATVLLGLVFANESLGWFGASHRVTMALHTFVWLYFFNLLPSIARCVGQPKSQLIGLMNRSMRLAAWTGLFGAFSITLLSREVLTILYGPDFTGASTFLIILIWILPVAMLSGHYRYTLIAYGLQTQLLYCTAVAAAAAVLLGLTLTPILGATGAALALLFANVLNFALVYRSVRKHVVRIRIRRQIPYPAMAMILSAVTFYRLNGYLNVWLTYAISVTVFAAVMVVLQRRQLITLFRMIAAKRQGDRAVKESWAR
jgi:O-antigen/teichoic acid export membrane protein